MSAKLKSVLLATTGVLFTSVVSATEVSLSEVTDYYVHEASQGTSVELQYAVYQDILNTTHKVSPAELELDTRVLISYHETESEDLVISAAE